MAADTISDIADEDYIITSIIDGDSNAFRVLVERYEHRIYNVIYGMVHSREDATELSQDVFIKAFQNLANFRIGSRFYTWICRIAINASIDFLRKRKFRQTSDFDEGIATVSDGVIFDGHARDNPERNASLSELHSRIIEEVQKLPDEQKQVLVLKEVDGLAYREIAEVLGVAQGTVMSRLFYARKRLQEALRDQYEEHIASEK